MIELLAGVMIGDMISPEALEFLGGITTVAPRHGELILAFCPEKFAGPKGAATLNRAETLLEAIVGQGARLPSQRRFAARVRSAAEGIHLTAAEVVQLERLHDLGLEAVN
ncbi:MAG: hypothetical protein V9G14_06625 [Cypionkella sp.]